MLDKIDLELKLRIMYLYTIIITFVFGLGILIAPAMVTSIFGWPKQDPIVLGITGSVYMTFGLVSILGLRDPLKFMPILLMQLCYKVIWVIAVVIPLLIIGQFPSYAILHVVIFATFIIGDIIVLPFSDLISKKSE